MSTRRKASPPPATMESTAALVREVFSTYCEDDLLSPRHQPGGTSTERSLPLVSWAFALTTNAQIGHAYLLTVYARREVAMCVEEVRASETRFYSLFGVDREAVTNALFHALSCPGSPYWFSGACWKRKGTIYG